ncbi:MAG: hypothetical protein M5U01_05705 [Ardenticatenaceae bacterium]|nr:hypothetical protein [Ardenticatenaceae bacterium]
MRDQTPRAPARAHSACNQGGGSCFSTIGAAQTGDTIRIAAGSYSKNILITRTVTLEGGWNAEFTARDPAANPTVVMPADSSRMVVEIVGKFGDWAAVAPTLDGLTQRLNHLCDHYNTGYEQLGL